MADHGVSFRVGATDRRTIVPANARDIAPVPLFIKFPRQRRGRIDRSLFRTYDVLPTIARRIGLRLPRGLSGRPAGSRAIRRRGRISVLSRASIGRVTFSRRGLRRAKRAALRRKLALFGQGPRSLFDFGPNRGLLLKTVNRYSVAGAAGGLRAQLSDPSDYQDVQLGIPVRPGPRDRPGARGPPGLAPRSGGGDQRLHPRGHPQRSHQGPQAASSSRSSSPRAPWCRAATRSRSSPSAARGRGRSCSGASTAGRSRVAVRVALSCRVRRDWRLRWKGPPGSDGSIIAARLGNRTRFRPESP